MCLPACLRCVLYNTRSCTNPVTAMLLFMAYELITAVLLLNIMIALMTQAFARASQDEGLRLSIYKAEVGAAEERTHVHLAVGMWPMVPR